ncbi:unnamed protein product, partial [Amoebophrya sp. A25]|eukprot:GSA25T00009325001.1
MQTLAPSRDPIVLGGRPVAGAAPVGTKREARKMTRLLEKEDLGGDDVVEDNTKGLARDFLSPKSALEGTIDEEDVGSQKQERHEEVERHEFEDPPLISDVAPLLNEVLRPPRRLQTGGVAVSTGEKDAFASPSSTETTETSPIFGIGVKIKPVDEVLAPAGTGGEGSSGSENDINYAGGAKDQGSDGYQQEHRPPVRTGPRRSPPTSARTSSTSSTSASYNAHWGVILQFIAIILASNKSCLLQHALQRCDGIS